MAYITFDIEKLRHNYNYLDALFAEHNISWGVVAKMFCGNEAYLRSVLDLGIKQVCDSRIGNLKIIKLIAPNVKTVFIKPAAKRNAQKVVEYADISFNTSLDTIQALSDAAVRLGKEHKIVIMVESGELREGVVQHDLLNFYEQVAAMPSIKIIGLGTNLTCMNGVLPSYDKLRRLEYHAEQIKNKFGHQLELLSGGASVTIPLIYDNELPEGINHFRIGETLFFGTDVYHNSTIPDMKQDLFKLYGEIIEIDVKPNVPTGKMGHNVTGTVMKETNERQRYSTRAIVDIGLLDIESRHIQPVNDSITIAGASSDMTVLDLGDNEMGYSVGDKIAFTMDYMGVLRIMNSKYIEKRIERPASYKLPVRLNKGELQKA